MHLSHLLYLVEVNDETALIRVVFLDALAAKDGQVIGAIKMLHTLIVFFTNKAVDALLIFKVDVP